MILALTVSVVGLLLFSFEGGFGGRSHKISAEVPRSFWLALLVTPLVLVAVMLGYAVVFPDLNDERSKQKPSMPSIEKGESALSAVLRILNEEERRVVETLVVEGGTMLQKDIRWRTGLSRVKTHRILFRLAERGVVSAEKYYNTNRIKLADWLKTESASAAGAK